MTKVTFIYCKNIKWYAVFSWIICIFEKYMSDLDASHTRVDVCKQTESGLNKFSIESVFPHGKITKEIEENKYLTIEQYSFEIPHEVGEILEWAERNVVGKRYSFSQNIFLAITSLAVQIFNPQKWDIEKKEFNGRAVLNCTEVQIMFLARFLNVIPVEDFDNFTVGEARDLVKQVWELKGLKNVNIIS